MRFTASKASLFEIVQKVVGVVEKRQTMQILSHIHLTAADNQLTAVASDMEVEIECSGMVHVEVAGQTTVPGKKFHDILRSLKDDAEVTLSRDGDRVLLTSGRSRFELNTLASEEYPRITAGEIEAQINVDAQILSKQLGKCQFSMAQQDVRYYLNGMLWELIEGELRTVATDGHRLAYAEQKDIADAANQAFRVIVPRKGVLELAKLLGSAEGEVQLSLSRNFIVLKLANTRVVSKLIEGRFPDYHRVIPQGNDKRLVSETAVLHQMLQRAAILANERYRGVRLQLAPNRLTVESENPEREHAKDEVEVDYDDTELSVGFNVNYLLDVLAHVDGDSVTVDLRDENSSALIRDVDNQSMIFVVMPMRL